MSYCTSRVVGWKNSNTIYYDFFWRDIHLVWMLGLFAKLKEEKGNFSVLNHVNVNHGLSYSERYSLACLQLIAHLNLQKMC